MPRPVRVPPQPPEEWSASTRAEFAGVASVATSAADDGDAPTRKPFRLPAVIAHHPTFLPPYLVWAKAVALDGVLPRRDATLIALRTALRCHSEFEWGVHADTALARVGFTKQDLDRVVAGPTAAGWTRHEAAILQAADDLHDTQAISDATWQTLRETCDVAAILEVAFVAGHYTMLSMVANSAGLPPEANWERLP
jgi:alkylhydroperoxidase family enzyme